MIRLTRVQEQALIRLYTTGDLGRIGKRILCCLFDAEVIVENAYLENTITFEGKEHLEKILPMLTWFPSTGSITPIK